MLQGFFVSVLSVRLRPCPFPYLPRQAASSFCCRILSFLPFSPCFPLFPNPYPGRPSEMRLEAFSPERRVHSSPELSDALKTHEKQLEKGIILKIYLFAIGLLSFQDFLTCLVECRRHYGGEMEGCIVSTFLKYKDKKSPDFTVQGILD